VRAAASATGPQHDPYCRDDGGGPHRGVPRFEPLAEEDQGDGHGGEGSATVGAVSEEARGLFE